MSTSRKKRHSTAARTVDPQSKRLRVLSAADSVDETEKAPASSSGWKPRDAESHRTEVSARRAKAAQREREGARPSWGARTQVRLGPGGARALYRGLWLLVRLLVIAIAYVVVVFTVSMVIPMLGIVLVHSTGVTDTSGTLSILATWLAPLIFLSGVVGLVDFWLVRLLWRFAGRISKQMGRDLGAIDDSITPTTSKEK